MGCLRCSRQGGPCCIFMYIDTQKTRAAQWTQGKHGNLRAAQRHIVGAYAALLLTVFPFYNTDHYFSILSDRARFFQAATWLMAAALLAEWGLYSLRRRKAGGGSETPGIQWRFRRISLEHALLGAFLLVSAASTLMSDFQMEAWTGSEGRLQGLAMWLAYGAAFFCISRYHRLREWHLWLFLAACSTAALWGICDYMGPGLSWWLADVRDAQKHMFTSSIGNINTYTAYIAIGLALSGAYAVYKGGRGERTRKAALFAVFSLLSIALATGRSDNAALGAAVFFLAAPVGIRDTRQAARYLGLLATFLLALPAAAFLHAHTGNPYVEVPDGILMEAGIQGWRTLLALSVAAMAAAVLLSMTDSPILRFPIAWIAFLAISGALLAAAALYANLFGGAGRYGAAGKYLEFIDSWGTYRGLCWRLAAESYGKFSPLKKLFGSGPETFGSIMRQEHYQEMVQGCGEVFDSPHNEFIQRLFHTGILGAACYYAFLVSCLIKGARGGAQRKAAAAAAFTYTAVSLVNISVPITQPYLIMLAAWCAGSGEELNEEEKYGY